MTRLPYIFILDWDGTIAGRVDYQSQQFTLHKALRQHGFRSAKQHAIPPAFYPNAKLIRPGFAAFIKTMKKMLPDAFFFIYTASEKTWAHQEIAWVEKTHGIQFMRPIFTREDCVVDSSGNYRKSLSKVFPRIMRVIAKQDAAFVHLSSKERQHILEKQTMIIDNNAVYTDRPDKLLLCPDYNYTVFENLLHGIPMEARNHPQIQQMIYGFVNQGLLCPLPSKEEDGMKALARQYKWLAVKCQSIIDMNQAFDEDDFWKRLKHLILQNNLRVFTPSIIRQLQEAVWKHKKTSKVTDNASAK